MTDKTRITWVDYAKGVGILLVVAGHTLRGLDGSPAQVPGAIAMDRWIYAFHMPLFFFLSGLFLEQSTRQPAAAYLDNKLRRILWPYFLWSVLQECFRAAAGASDLRDLWRIVYAPVMQFWFLYVLFLLMVVYLVWRKAGLPWWGFAVGISLLHVSLGWGVSYGAWGVVYQLWIYGPYLALGIWAAQWRGFPMPDRLPARCWPVVALTGYGLVTVVTLPFFYDGIWVKTFAAVAGILASLFLAALLVGTRFAVWIRMAGVYSMEIFVAHTIFSATCREVLLRAGIVNPWVHLILGVSLGLLGPFGLAMIVQKSGPRWIFSLPRLHET